MRRSVSTGTLLLFATLSCGFAVAQANPSDDPAANAPAYQPGPRAVEPLSPVPLEWTPPALAQLSATAAMKSSFTLDRNMLDAAAAVLPDDDGDVRMTLHKLDGVSVHILRFGQEGMIDPRAIASIRNGYHLRGWKHLATANDAAEHGKTTDVWVVMDGVTIKGAVILAETPKSVTLVTVAGNMNPIDILHLRGHFGIPRFDRDVMHGENVQ